MQYEQEINFFFFFKDLIYLRERKRESTSMEAGAQKEREKISC